MKSKNVPANVQIVLVGSLLLAASAAVVACKGRDQSAKLATASDTAGDSKSGFPVMTVSAKNSDGLSITDKKIDGSEMFNRGPLAYSGLEQMPFVLFRVMPELAMAIDGKWTLGQPGHELEESGFFYDTRPGATEWPVPLGFTWTVPGPQEKPAIAYAIRTCASCHASRVMIDGKTEILEGTGNNQMDFHVYTDTWVQFVFRAFSLEKRAATAAEIIRLVDSKPRNWFFNGQASFDREGNRVAFDEPKAAEQVQVLKDNLEKIMDQVFVANERRRLVEIDIDAGFKTVPEAKQQSNKWGPPGIADTNANGIYTMVFNHNHNPAIPADKKLGLDTLYKGATKVRIPSVWEQKKRRAAQWTANVTRTFFRNAVAAMGFAQNSAKDLNGLHLEVLSHYIGELNPPKYVGSVNQAKAARGKAVFESAQCASCHVPDHAMLPGMPPVMRVGTSSNRMNSSTPGLGAVVVPQLWAVCSGNNGNKTLEVTIDGTTTKPCDIDPRAIMLPRTAETTGYPSTPLDGLWAKAPYLHNGSVPTLYHLLAKKGNTSLRPEVFATGNAEYDQQLVGWRWNIESKKSDRHVYDTKLDGFSNRGHEGSDASGMWVDPATKQTFKLSWNVDNAAEKEQLDALLEYLKTL